MNDNLQQAIEKLINKTIDGVDASVNFLQTELPDFIYQLLLWYGVYTFILFLSAIAVIALYLRCVLWVYRYRDGDGHPFYKSHSEFVKAAPIAVLGFGAFMPFVACDKWLNLTWLKIWIAPKVWLVEYASTLVK